MLFRQYSLILPSTIMGEKNYNTAVKTVAKYLGSNKPEQAEEFVSNQLKKIKEQTKK